MSKQELFGLAFDQVTLEQAVLTCIEMMKSRVKNHTVVTANLDVTRLANQHKELKQFIQQADLVLCDGQPIVWWSKLKGKPLPERVAGADLVPKLLAICAEQQLSVYFLGSVKLTGLTHCGHYSPPIAPIEQWDNAKIIEDIKSISPNLLLVAVGCPKQELWLAKYGQHLNVPLSIGIGASLDFMVGKQQRAPRFLQKIGLEWFWRMCLSPRRLTGRYMKDIWFLLKEAIK